jgi:glutathione S-transferase
LYPPPGLKRLEALKWMTWGSVSFIEAVQRFFLNTSDRWPVEQRSVGAADAARHELNELLRILDGALAGRQFILGDQFSLADCGIMTMVAFVGRLGVDLSVYPNVSGWTGRCMSRPALGRAMAG